MELESPKPPIKRTVRGVAMQLLPWVVTAALVVYLVHTTDLPRAWEALRRANIALLVLYSLLTVAIAYIVDTFSLKLAFSRFHHETTMGDLLPVKAASYLLNILNYNAAAGSIALMMKVRREVPVVEGLGTMLWVSVVDLAILNLMALVGTLFVDLGSGAFAVRAVNVGIIGAFVGSLIYWNGGFDFFVLGRLRGWRVFNGFRVAALRDYATIGLVRVVLIVVYILSNWLVLPLFGIPIPLHALFVYIPILALINVLPISVSGLGTGQVVMRVLFSSYVILEAAQHTRELTDPVVDAFSTAFIIVQLVFRIALGLVCLPIVSRDIKRRQSAEASLSARDEARSG